MKAHPPAYRLLMSSVFVAALAGCGAALAAGAGAGAAIAYSERGVSSTVEGSVDEVIASSREAFAEMNIQETSQRAEDSGTEHELKGRVGDTEVTVNAERENDTLTDVEVFAQESALEWDRDFARDILARIISKR